MLKTGFMNIYKSGYFHRKGKPKAFDRHSGDIYPEYEDAIREIDPISHYVCTVLVAWDDPEDIQMNPPESVPVPLSVSRRQHAEQYPSLAPVMADE